MSTRRRDDASGMWAASHTFELESTPPRRVGRWEIASLCEHGHTARAAAVL